MRHATQEVERATVRSRPSSCYEMNALDDGIMARSLVLGRECVIRLFRDAGLTSDIWVMRASQTQTWKVDGRTVCL